MLPNKSLSVVFALSLALSLSACGSRVRITDTEWCADVGAEGALCFRTLSETRRAIPKAQWDEERYGQICSTADTFAEWKAALLKLCEDTGRCDYQTQQTIQRFEQKLHHVSVSGARR